MKTLHPQQTVTQTPGLVFCLAEFRLCAVMVVVQDRTWVKRAAWSCMKARALPVDVAAWQQRQRHRERQRALHAGRLFRWQQLCRPVVC